MKTKQTIIFAGLIILALTVSTLSCDNPVGLDTRLDLNGPIIEITSPSPRKAVTSQFTIEGTALDASGVDRMVISTEKNREPYPKQWRYNKGKWEVSVDHGKNWTAYSGYETQEQEPRFALPAWALPVDMNIGDEMPKDGEYLFSVQAWDKGGFTDDNSYKTIVLIVDNNPPSVEISNPYLYHRASYNGAEFTNAELKALHDDDSDAARFNPNNIGKFLTQDFKLQWQIEENASDIWSIDLRFYQYDETVDEDEGTFLNDNFIFSYTKNTPPPSGDSSLLSKPNGSVIVPALHGSAESWSLPDGGSMELKNPLTDKTTIKVVSICYDSAGHANEERVLGYFIYWEKAGEPWITFTDGMKAPDAYYGEDIETIKDDIFMIYPGRDIKATAFQAHGVGGVKYSVYKCGDTGTLTAPDKNIPENVIAEGEMVFNISRSGGTSFSTVYPWSFPPPPMTGYYIVEAYAYGSKLDGDQIVIDYDNESAVNISLFRVQDISFPKFDPIIPAASDPLFMQAGMNNGEITISGTVTDATRIENIYMVWINPKAKDYAAMSQLQYYRDKDYTGWMQAAALQKGTSGEEDEATYESYDGAAPNRFWNINFTPAGETDTRRQIFHFSVKINLASELGIGIASNLNDLKSQMFLLRAENPDHKCDIITYAPQGDTLAPTIEIERVSITKSNGTSVPDCTPGIYNLIPQFQNGDIITIHGRWEEDSIEYLDFNTFLKPNFEFLLNGNPLTHDPTNNGVEIAYVHTPNTTEGTFTIKVTLANTNGWFNLGYFRDTVMVNMKVHDIGGNPAEQGDSWLVQGDTLKFLRISSEDADETYKAGDKIEIFLEFSKPVVLNPDPARIDDPVLQLSSGGTATYGKKDGTPQNVEKTRQYFIYTVGASQNTQHNNTPPVYLNVSGIQGTDTDWSANTYRFMWQHISDGTTEEVRLTGSAKATGGLNPPHTVLPTSGNQSLGGGKQISIDTTAPTGSVSATTGRHSLGAEVFITVTFNENVKLDMDPVTNLPINLPYLVLSTGNSNTITYPNRTIYTSADEISVARNTIRFRYVVQTGDTTGTSQLTVTGIGGKITDLAGNEFVGTWPQTLTNVYLDTLTPTHPQIQIVNSSNTQINNTVSGATRNGNSNTAGGASWDSATPHGSRIIMENVYNDVVRIQVTPSGAYNTDFTKLEYSTNNGKDWVQFTGITSTTTVCREPLPMNGSYNVTARQTDAAGNVSQWTVPISLTWDSGGNFISRIETTAGAGTYTNRATPLPARDDSIPITVYFRKPVTFGTAPTLTLNARNTPTGTGGTQATAPATSAALANGTPASITATGISSITFTYTVGSSDNTAASTPLAVSSINISGEVNDASGVQVTTLATTLPAVTNFGKNIYIQTGALTLSTGPTWARTGTGEEWAGTISLTFNRDIIKGTTGNITIAQSTTGYRLPAVLTEAQSSRYRNIANFGKFYTKGTNGFSGSSPDTATKYVLNYAESAVVTPNSGAIAGTIERLAYDFHTAESVTIPVTSQDVSVVNGNTLRITLAGSNALQVLGASYTLTIPANIAQDNLGYTWSPPNTYPNTTDGINRPFTRVDKQTNTDTINGYGSPTFSTPTNQNGSTTQPWLVAVQVIQTTARLDCRTPNSVVRYVANGTAHTATGVTTNAAGTADGNWRNTNADTQVTYPNQGNPTTSSTLYGGTNGTDFTQTITVGDNTEQGYVWRISTRSYRSNSNTEATSSDVSEEVAFRSVITVELTGNARSQYGQLLDSGDQLWIHGGDAKSSSSVPGYPLTWDVPTTEGTRAGMRLMRKDSTGNYNYTAGTNNNTADSNSASRWRWVSWEINVPTYFEIVLGRGVNASNAPDTGTRPSAQEAWWYGPRVWAPQRGGWAARDTYPLNPGRHRWVRFNESAFVPGGVTNFASSWQTRSALTAPTVP